LQARQRARWIRLAMLGEQRTLSWEAVHSMRWLRLCLLKYRDSQGKERAWEACVRTTRPLPTPSGAGARPMADGVAIFAVLRSRHAPPRTLLVRQFRPPMNCETVELPAGLIDEGESAVQAAVRELREETGYAADASTARVSAPVCLSPGLTNEAVHLVQLEVDADAPENRTPMQALEETEAIRVLEVPLGTLPTELDVQVAQGATVFGALQTLRIGMEVGRGLAGWRSAASGAGPALGPLRRGTLATFALSGAAVGALAAWSLLRSRY